MDAVVKFPSRASCQVINYSITKRQRLNLRSLSIKRTCNLHSDKMERLHHGISFKRTIQGKSWDDNRISATSSNRDPKAGPNSFSPSETVDQFYTCINEKKLHQLGECISQDARFDYYSFHKPFQGKEEVMQFLEQLTASLGQNVKFRVGQICEGDDFTAVANWHLEWKKAQIPFTRGCSFFKFSEGGEKIIIRRAEVLIESPIKPGSIVLTLLKTVTSLFDDFPDATEWFLRSPYAVLKWIMKFYNMFVAPFLNPLIDSYIKLWSLMIRLLGYAYNVLIFISKIFFE